MEMTKLKNGHTNIHDRLHQAIDELRKDVTRVEIWATALGSFSQPVPDYRPDEKITARKALEISPKIGFPGRPNLASLEA